MFSAPKWGFSLVPKMRFLDPKMGSQNRDVLALKNGYFCPKRNEDENVVFCPQKGRRKKEAFLGYPPQNWFFFDPQNEAFLPQKEWLKMGLFWPQNGAFGPQNRAF